MPTMHEPASDITPLKTRDTILVQGLPRINYHLPVIVTLLAAVVVLAVLALLSVLALLNAFTQFERADEGIAGGSAVAGGMCGVLALLGFAGTAFFLTAVVRGVRDLWSPVQYTRGTVADKRATGGRMSGHWMGVTPRYTGPDLEAASHVTDEQRAASPDRTQILQPRFGRKPAEVRRGSTAGGGGYLPAERIRAGDVDATVLTGREARKAQADNLAASVAQGMGRDIADDGTPRVVFRVDPISHQVLLPGDEVLIAHSRYLHHIFYVAHLRNGEWESFRNKTLI